MAVPIPTAAGKGLPVANVMAAPVSVKANDAGFFQAFRAIVRSSFAISLKFGLPELKSGWPLANRHAQKFVCEFADR